VVIVPHVERPGYIAGCRATDFVHDQLAGRKLRVLTIIDTSRASRWRSNLGLTSAALTLWRYSNKSAGKSDPADRVGQGTEFVSRGWMVFACWRDVMALACGF
jgi:hypothetical protein